MGAPIKRSEHAMFGEISRLVCGPVTFWLFFQVIAPFLAAHFGRAGGNRCGHKQYGGKAGDFGDDLFLHCHVRIQPFDYLFCAQTLMSAHIWGKHRLQSVATITAATKPWLSMVEKTSRARRTASKEQEASRTQADPAPSLHPKSTLPSPAMTGNCPQVQ